jgi:hypothetical protein
MSGNRFAMKLKAILRQAFMRGSAPARDSETCCVPRSDNDLDARLLQLFEREF